MGGASFTPGGSACTVRTRAHLLADPPSSSSFLSSDWRLHVLRLPEGMGRCVPCNKVFKRFQAAKRHYQVHHVGRCDIVQCCYCHKTFNEYAFRTHLNSKHNIRGIKNVVQLYGKLVQ